MRVIINFTEEKPKELRITDAVASPSLRGIAIRTVELTLLFRFYGLNILKEGEEKYYYRPFNDDDLSKDGVLWYEVKRMPKSVSDIANNYLIISSVRNKLINKLLNSRRDEHTRKTH